MATQTVQATNTAPKKKIKIAPIVCFIVTVLLAVLFVYPVYFAVISAFKSNGEILKAPLAFPTEMYLTYKGQNLMARVAPTSKSRRGDKVTMAMDTHKIHLFDPETELTLLN